MAGIPTGTVTFLFTDAVLLAGGASALRQAMRIPLSAMA